MAQQTTRPFKNTLSGSIGAGMGSLFAPSGKKYYILEHRISSKYHKAGESQEIIVDNIEIGRDSHCQVRFDESFKTVSRHHAAIVREGDNWKLVQISNTNSTFLNGRPVKKEWYLQNGDEIQLSVNGPKLGFILPTGKKSTVGSIALTRRLSLFRQQALRPYKTAITALSLLLVLSVGGLSFWHWRENQKNHELLAAAEHQIRQLKEEALILQKEVEQKGAEIDSILDIKGKEIIFVKNQIEELKPNNQELQVYETDIYLISAVVCAVVDGNLVPLETVKGDYLGWRGTGFLLNDKRFVTAWHCVEGWKFDTQKELVEHLNSLKDDTMKQLFMAGLTGTHNVRLESFIVAKSPSKKLQFCSSDFKVNKRFQVKEEIGEGLSRLRVNPDGGGDWAYVNTDKVGCIEGDAYLSSTLPAGSRLEVLGYPKGLQTESGSCLYGSCQTSSKGLNEGVILITGKNYEHGNSGGPVFYRDKGKYKAIGIVSFGIFESMGGITPLYNLK